MPKRLFSNNARARLGVAIVTTGTLATITVESGKGGLFPSPSGGDWFDLTIEDASKNVEIFKIVGRSGDVLTVGSSGNDRAQQSTTARTFDTTAIVGIRVTRLLLSEFTDHLASAAGAHPASAISFVAAGSIAATTVQAAVEELDTEKYAKTGGTISGAVTISTGGLTIGGGGITVSAGGAAITGNSTITGTLGVSAALTVSTGGLTVTAGGLTVTAGGLTVTAGGASITGTTGVTGAFTVTGAATVTNGVTVSGGNLVVSAGSLQAIANGETASGVLYLGNSGARYLQYASGSGVYVMPNAELVVNNKTVVNALSSSTLSGSIGSNGTLTLNMANIGANTFSKPGGALGISSLETDAYGRLIAVNWEFG